MEYKPGKLARSIVCKGQALMRSKAGRGLPRRVIAERSKMAG